MGKSKKSHRKASGSQQPAARVPQANQPAAVVANPLGAQADSDDLQKQGIDALLSELETHRNRPAIVYWLSQAAKISYAVELPLVDQLSRLPSREGLDLVLFTFGGDTEAPGRLINLIRSYTDHLAILIPHLATSAGTLMALGADEVLMTRLASLGPIDPSRVHPLLPKRAGANEPEPVSVQDMRHAMEFIREAVGPGNNPTAEAWAQIFTALFRKIHPLAIGAIEQSYALAKLTAKKCLETHMDPQQDAAKIMSIIDALCDGYKSHHYRIGRSEAAAIGIKVAHPDDDLEDLLYRIMVHYNKRPIVPGLSGPPQKGHQIRGHIAWIDSLRYKSRCVQQLVAEDGGVMRPLGDSWASY